LQVHVPSERGTVLSVNVGLPREIERGGRSETSGIWKTPMDGPVRAEGVNLAGDQQADLSVHGGYDKAVYAYAIEDIAWWEAELDREIGPGVFGENLTVEGLDLATALVGERWRVGTAELEVSEPRLACWKLGIRMGDPTFPAAFNRAGRTGAYLRIVGTGEIAAGDTVDVLSRPGHGVTVHAIWGAYAKREDASVLLAAPELSEGWRAWAHDRLGRAGGGARSA
jgi:MOSC domain-containing protein YiiM